MRSSISEWATAQRWRGSLWWCCSCSPLSSYGFLAAGSTTLGMQPGGDCRTSVKTSVRPLALTKGARLGLGLILFYVEAATLSIVFVFPFFWALASSFKTIGEINTYPPPFLPAVPQWSTYA